MGRSPEFIPEVSAGANYLPDQHFSLLLEKLRLEAPH